MNAFNGWLERRGPAAGRVLLSAIFLLSGLSKLTGWSGMAAHMEQQGLPLVPLLLAGAVVTELAGGLALLAGWQTRWAALALFAFLIPTSVLFHGFWSYTGAEGQMQQIHFLKNLAIMGGLLGFAARGAGELSLDAALSRRAPAAPRQRELA